MIKVHFNESQWELEGQEDDDQQKQRTERSWWRAEQGRRGQRAERSRRAVKQGGVGRVSGRVSGVGRVSDWQAGRETSRETDGQ